ncbi:Plasma membrane sulfite pump involved in sulfite metabolism [Rhinocladiella similis]
MEPRRPGLTRLITSCADALSKTLTQGTGDNGDLKTWCPDLGVCDDGEGDVDNRSSTTATTATSERLASARATHSGIARSLGKRPEMDEITKDVERGGPGREQPTQQGHDDEEERGWRKFVKYFTPS